MIERELYRKEEKEYGTILLSKNNEETKNGEDYRKSEAKRDFGNAKERRIFEADCMLSEYRTIEHILEIAKETSKGKKTDAMGRMLGDENEMQLRMQMYEIRRLIMSLADDEGKLFL